ncbi:hypothetical protein DCAR_0934737 [Daucus carota subsp. sativus]|uniref:Dihydroflavonol 4-reductase n=1 Tax=Daucus carota subsp. sativus TaxID=79200 RepID=A0AAF1BD99_DAUCS|nr:hypothetical protein DCAR_0934737 [Daucus carota subsp. sativus]
MSGDGKRVCVTGASGFIASWLVKFLLLRGYTVHATVRDPCDPKKTKHLLALDGAVDRLHLYRANLLEEGSFDAATDGCEGVFHMASPFIYTVNDPQAELIDPAVKGTLNVLRSCAKARSVKRVVLTSSIAAVTYNGRPKTPDVIVDETWFSDIEICRKRKLWYVLSKTLAEDAAWKFAKERGIDMVTINPAMVIGPLLQPSLNTSAAEILNLIKGAQTFPNASLGWVNVKDITSANGRYCMVESVAHYSELLDKVRYLYPSLQLPVRQVFQPNWCANDKPFVPTYQVSKKKIESLGISYIPLKESLGETVESLRERKYFALPSAL